MAGNQQQTNFKLTDEEKAVLLECRRNSIARGVPIGVVSVLGLRYFLNQGILPHSIKRWSIFYYSGTFLIATIMGMASYRQKCMDKIMSLENSYLADQLRQHMSRQGNEVGGVCSPDSSGDKKRRDASHEKSTDSLPLPITSNEGYASDNMWINTAKENTGKDSDASAVKKGRSFDEIRDQHRSKQIQQNFPPPHPSAKRLPSRESESREQGSGVPCPVKRNKYGDIIYED